MSTVFNPQHPIASTWTGGPLDSSPSSWKRRFWFTLGALAVYRLGTYIPIPGIDPIILEDLIKQQPDSLLGMFNMFVGGAFGRMAIFALGVMPYISASIIVQLLTAISPHFEALTKEGAAGRKKINQYTRYGTVLLAALQGYGIAIGLESWRTQAGLSAVVDPGLLFRVTAVVTLVGGTIFLMWLGEQISCRGVGNGISLIIFSGIVANLPGALLKTVDLNSQGQLQAFLIIALIFGVAAVSILIVFVDRAQRRILVQYPKRQVGDKEFGGDSSFLPLNLNTAGVIPPIFASTLLLSPLTVAGLSQNSTSEWLTYVTALLSRGQPVYFLIYGALIVFLAFFYAAVVLNPTETAENLHKYGGFVPGYRPGANTAAHLDFTLTRLTAIGAIYLAAICTLPDFLISQYWVPFYLGGTSLFIVVNVAVDTLWQIQVYLLRYGNREKRKK